jgi:hypothetical protein
MQEDTPRFFIVLRNIGLIVAAVSVYLLTQPVELPPLVIKIAEYLGVGAGVMTAVSQTAVKNEEE